MKRNTTSNVTYTDEAFLLETEPIEGYHVIEVNTQGILDLTAHGRNFRKFFPVTYEKYVAMCASRSIKPGDVVYEIENDYHIVLMCVAEHITKKMQDDISTIEMAIDNSIAALQDFVVSDDRIVMPVPMRNMPVVSQYFMRQMNNKFNLPIKVCRS